jgi:SAM-dependent methyltransferase
MDLEQTKTEQRLASERQFHDERYGTGEDTRGHLDKFYVAIKHGDDRMAEIVRELGTGKDVLEYGCADGVSAVNEMRAPAFAATYTGIDIAPLSVKLAAGKAAAAGYTNCEFLAMNAEEMEFPDNRFDLIYGHGILHHLDLAKCYGEIHRTLKPGGHAVFMEPLGHNPVLNWYRDRTPSLRTPDEHPLVAGDFALAEQFFSKVELEFFGLTTLLALPLQRTPLSQVSLSVFRAVDRALFASPMIRRNAWYALMKMTK